ncbi:recombination mediator RecR [Terriglobus tenax]|uniref:recombination mediator RecR n=1 Tax=Terriglobus tenax TaxID=1111115 RepID=UPI0021DF5679|nr:recombination mediator RecR [Terriglobus tenax]
MARFAEPMARLIEELRKLPGIGTKSAQRLAFHILRASTTDAEALSKAILQLKASLRLCSRCNNITDIDPCSICSNPTRNQRLICVVEEPTNIGAIEKTRTWNGVFHVLHGTLSPVNGIGPEQIRTTNLFNRLADTEEVILALSPTVEGEATSHYLAQEIHRIAPQLAVTRIATGVPAGSDIEYADEITLTRALDNRRQM